ncbi:MAG TPA: neutral zinc metallopeptidase [Acidimicrobiales bacterium]|nr:neutral zinc metallopeptidase [Acidimicrobiales bacterium]
MRWRRGADGSAVEDRRGQGFTPGRIGAAGGGMGLIGLLLTLLLSGGLGGGGGGPVGSTGLRPAGAPDPDADMKDFVTFVVNDVQETWEAEFARTGRTYEPTTLVLFEQMTSTGCGTGQSASGPFYCPADRKIYLDMSFFRELGDRFGAPGDFAQAYVIAHEFGHHIQTLLGTSDQVRQGDNEASVRLELQADCLAGVWGNSAFDDDLLDPGDVEEGLAAAAAIGDDRLQKQSGQRVNPESWTHGSSEQRVKWFRSGFDTGNVNDCNTFA